MFKAPHRRLKVFARTLLIMGVLFFATILICTIGFVLFSSTGIKILSPITHVSGQESSNTTVSEIKTFCQNNHISCSSVVAIDDNTVQITLDTGGLVFLSMKKDLGRQLASLQQVIAQLTIKGKQFKKLDFRFDNVIVSF